MSDRNPSIYNRFEHKRAWSAPVVNPDYDSNFTVLLAQGLAEAKADNSQAPVLVWFAAVGRGAATTARLSWLPGACMHDLRSAINHPHPVCAGIDL